MTVAEMFYHCHSLIAAKKGEYELTVWVKDSGGKKAVEIDLFQSEPIVDDNERFVAFDLDE